MKWIKSDGEQIDWESDPSTRLQPDEEILVEDVSSLLADVEHEVYEGLMKRHPEMLEFYPIYPWRVKVVVPKNKEVL